MQPGDTIICLGDVAHPDAWRDRRLVLDLRACPGERILILGNHDVDHTEALQQAGFAEECTAVLCFYRLASGVCRLHGGSTPRLPVSRSKALRRVGARDRDGS